VRPAARRQRRRKRLSTPGARLVHPDRHRERSALQLPRRRMEPAVACAATILVVSFLAVVPVGLVWARVDHVNLRKVAVESEHAGVELAEAEPAPPGNVG